MDNRVCKKCDEEKPLDLFVKNGQWRKHICKACDSKRVVAQAKADPERAKAKVKAWREANPEKAAAMDARRAANFRKNSPEKLAAARARYRQSEHGRQKELEYGRAYNTENRDLKIQKKLAWMKANPHKVNAATGRRRAAQIKATPAWANEFFMEEAYDLARRRTEATGIKWEVDHIVPLLSKLVCGLHAEQNLRVIPQSINRSKNNRYWPDMPERN